MVSEKERGFVGGSVTIQSSAQNIMAHIAGEPELIYSPCWFIEYRMGRKVHSVIVDAPSRCVVAEQRPWIPKGAKWR